MRFQVLVAQGDHVGPRVIQAPGLAGGEPHAGGVLSVDHGEVDVMLPLELPQAAGQDVLAALAYNIANRQNVQQHCVSSLDGKSVLSHIIVDGAGKGKAFFHEEGRTYSCPAGHRLFYTQQ